MKSSTYAAAGELVLAGVTLKAKYKRCQKANCAACPHGPYWYALGPAYVAADQRRHRHRFEIYLSGHWNEDSLRALVLPALRPDVRTRFEAELQALLDAERLAALGRKLADARADLKRETANWTRRKRELIERCAQLNQEAAALEAKLHPPAARKRVRPTRKARR